MKKVAILGIDLQNDFTELAGALYVDGAESDVSNIVKFINRNKEKIDYIALTLDSHQPIHVATPNYWRDSYGNSPSHFTVISDKDVIDGKWIPQYHHAQTIDYLKKLTEQGEVCTIWPAHCVLGDWGWAINRKLMDSLYKWSIDEAKFYDFFYKGSHPSTEHYSIFKAAVTYKDAPETHLNQKLIDKLNSFDEVVVVGEAADFCVANSLKDIVEHAPKLTSKIVMLTDCMSWIESYNPKAIEIFSQAEEAGVRFMDSTEYM